ncbi:MAG TPA: YsnF/AvaK domain-containing protein [Tepidisphaeraceae bacterium]|jgi:uncharacterized protein (TIGR02271 family)|nr:YsnF/AvaK domain-containing protein [Tepidisphaeraceae bacterium]
MNDPIKVTYQDESVGSVDATAWHRDDDQPVVVQLRDGTEVVAERTFFRNAADGSLTLQPSAGNRATTHGQSSADDAAAMQANLGERLVIPLLREQLEVSKRSVERGRVRIIKSVREETETIDHPLMKERVNVDRVEVNKFVDGPVPVRYEGDVMIVPVLEEVLVIETRLMLKEELRITKTAQQVHEPRDVTVRIEEARVERVSSEDNK